MQHISKSDSTTIEDLQEYCANSTNTHSMTINTHHYISVKYKTISMKIRLASSDMKYSFVFNKPTLIRHYSSEIRNYFDSSNTYVPYQVGEILKNICGSIWRIVFPHGAFLCIVINLSADMTLSGFLLLVVVMLIVGLLELLFLGAKPFLFLNPLLPFWLEPPLDTWCTLDPTLPFLSLLRVSPSIRRCFDKSSKE